MNEVSKRPPIFTPNNETYLGRESVFNFDQVILSCLEANAEIATYTHKNEKKSLCGEADGNTKTVPVLPKCWQP